MTRNKLTLVPSMVAASTLSDNLEGTVRQTDTSKIAQNLRPEDAASDFC
jgi:hypothetical protein